MNLSKISVCMIVKNAQNHILRCLNSVKEFGEIVIVDNQSDDKTIELIEEFRQNYKNLQLFSSEFIGFGPLKNLAISKAKNEWIFLIDSDEILESLDELKNINLNINSIVALPRKNLYKNEWIKACGWDPDFVFRIFNKNFSKFNDNLVHESLILPKETQKIYLKTSLIHYAFNDISHLITKMQKYSTLWAQQNLHKKSTPIKALNHGAFTFFKHYFLKKGICYGYKGFIISFCNALGGVFKYMKAFELSIPKTSLIITTYNQKERLNLVLNSVKNLTPSPNEVIIADDGSKEDTKELINKFMLDFSCPLKHVWQEDKGFRAAKSRNLAIKAAKNEYIILIDGDMILEKKFIKDHLAFAQKGVLLQGSRIILNENESDKILKTNDFTLAFKHKDIKALRSKILAFFMYKFSKTKANFFDKKEIVRGSKTCNMSFFKADFNAIDGFNENFEGWGREDSEFVARFLFNGGFFHRLKFYAIAYHIYHLENDKNMLDKNHQLYLDTIKNRKISWKKV
ncbi:glycosyltransferase [Campylobacter sp. LR196d]|uniref:glycosyltransferase family 2 protein n=1 Tax=Campylobacter sp. LR196d TaxID=2593543 RepID=UPI00123A2C58|nr:glycosyltransferase [Campylobacter sp. LR196d]KAA6225876.1 glycosyltransferase [Campylobacter sp. LR196d]